jgi:tyrosinase
MNMTPSVHATANFMHWHRYYIWAYETALRTECGYEGYQYVAIYEVYAK